jgi:hypothetical protein
MLPAVHDSGTASVCRPERSRRPGPVTQAGTAGNPGICQVILHAGTGALPQDTPPRVHDSYAESSEFALAAALDVSRPAPSQR